MSPQSYYRIDLPATGWSFKPRLVKVVPSSAKSLRQHVERFARYFLREMHFDGIQFEAAETPQSLGYVPYKAYLFAAQDRYIGAGCFRYREDQDAKIPWLFDWMWLHPYFRREGHLTQAWPALLQEFGTFRLGHPLSISMEAFLRKVGWQA
jgi:hypothetical protein